MEMATKSKLLVRSHAVRESTSPPRESLAHNLKTAADNHQHQQQPHHNSTSSSNSETSNGGGSVNQSTIYEEHNQQTDHNHLVVVGQGEVSENGTGSGGYDHHQQERDNGGRDSRAEVMDNYGDNRSNEMYQVDDSPTMINKRITAAKMNGQKKLEHQSSSQSQGGQKSKFKTMGSSSSMEGVSSGFISRGQYFTSFKPTLQP